MDNKQMQIEALESMNTGREGYFWDSLAAPKMFKGVVKAIYPKGFRDALYDQRFFDWNCFSFTDPRPCEAPSKDTVVMVKNRGHGWSPYISVGKFSETGNLIVTGYNDDNEMSRFQVTTRWQLLTKDCTVPEDLL